MTTKASIDDFLSRKTLALVGASRKNGKFGNAVLKDLTKNGYTIYPVHPKAESIEGVKCYPSLAQLPEKVEGVINVVKPQQTEKVVRAMKEAGIDFVWMQQGSQSDAAILFCEENGIKYVAGECIFMFVEPVQSIHKFHRFLMGLFGKLPK